MYVWEQTIWQFESKSIVDVIQSPVFAFVLSN